MEKWILSSQEVDEYEHHECSYCGNLAIFDYTYEEEIDYDYDEEPYSAGIVCTGIKEHITKFCPNCGKEMDRKEAMFHVHGCLACKHFDGSRETYTNHCKDCGNYPWSSYDSPIIFELDESHE